MNVTRVPRGGVMAAWLVGMIGVASTTGGCSLLFGADEHQGGVPDGSVDLGADTGIDAAEACAEDADRDDDGADAIECGGMDCDDTRDDVYPGAPEICANDVDEACGGAALRELLAVESTVTEHPARTLFSFDQLDLEATPFVAPISLASTTAGESWFVAASIESDGGNNSAFIIRATGNDPTSFVQISNYIAAPPELSNLVSIAVIRDGNTPADPDMDLIAVRRSPDGNDIAAYYGDIDTSGTDIAITSLGGITTTEDVSFRPGGIMTGGAEPPRWVVGEIGAASLPDRLNSCRQGSPATCVEVDSTLAPAESRDPVNAAGSPSGHVFFTTSNGNLAVWDLTSNGETIVGAADVISDATTIQGRPAVAQVGVMAGAPNRHHYVLALRYQVQGGAIRLALVPVVCSRAQTLGTCSLGDRVEVTGTSGTPSGPLAIVGYGAGRFALFFGTRAAAGDALRMLTGSYDVSAPDDPISLGGTRVIEAFPGNSNRLRDVAAAYLERVTQRSVISVMWQDGTSQIALDTTAFSFCQEP
jgi:hypothetical protein